ncbi:MAG: hypothetical protein IT186_05840 [Acidobacteria bacterium]|nr:hypothetical protein [Acidobacteriota bacterium]MCG3192145.1 hypothetical protein [Thermoanaerobaculia bacterium]MCK6682913.1 hypothetical protein [Thermoanaerobaculia bacterium]
MKRALPAGLALFVFFGSGCTTIARLTNLEDPLCRETFQRQLARILTEEGETQEAAGRLATQFPASHLYQQYGPRPFLIQAPSGTDYTLFVEKKKSGCLLRLVEKQKGFTRYTNNLTYINTQPLPSCFCEE